MGGRLRLPSAQRLLLVAAQPAFAARTLAAAPGASHVTRRAFGSSSWNPLNKIVKATGEGDIKAAVTQIAMGTGAVLAVYGVSKSFIWVTTTMMNISFSSALSMGFVTGFAAAGACGGMLLFANRLLTIRPEGVFKQAYKRIIKNPTVEAALGPVNSSGKLRAYKIDGGYFGTVDGRFGWQPPRVQMLFQVVGQWCEGIVTVEATQEGGKIRINLLALDALGKTRRLHLLEGSEQRLHVVGQLRGFLQTERARYLEQDLKEEVEDELDDAQEEVEEEVAEGGADDGKKESAR